MNNPNALSMTLCSRCRADFESSGRKLVKHPNQTYKDICDICQVRFGWMYAVKQDSGIDNDAGSNTNNDTENGRKPFDHIN